MNIMIFSAQYLPTVGGVERYTYELSKILTEKGHTVSIVTSKLKSQSQTKIVVDDIKIYRLPSLFLMGGSLPVVKYSKEILELGEIFKNSPPDFCLIQTRLYPLSLFAAKLCKKYSVPNLVLEHGSAYVRKGGFRGFIDKIYENLTVRQIKKKAKNFRGVSSACIKWLKKFGIHTDIILYNAVDVKNVAKEAKIGEESLKSRLSADILQGDKIVFSGRFVKEKGIIELLSAFEIVKKTHPNVKLIFAGEGAMLSYMEENLPKGAVILGKLSHRENLALIKIGDIYCLPTGYGEGFPTTLLEAAAVKTMVITTNFGNQNEFIKNESYGLICKVKDSKDLAEKLKLALNDKNYRKNCAENLFSRVEENFTWENTCDKFIDMAENIIKKEKYETSDYNTGI